MHRKELKMLYKSDLYRYGYGTSLFIFFKNLMFNPGFKYMYLFRKCQYHRSKKWHKLLHLLNNCLLRKYMYKFGYEISSSTKIGKGFYIGHIGGITINSRAEIGDNVNIAKGVTIGQTNRGERKGVPHIGNMVWIGVNATIVGKIIIGNNVLIAPNTYVNIDIPDNTIVIGNPAKIIPKKDATTHYINNVV